MSFGQEDLLLGRIALHYKLVTQDQLTQAAAKQGQEGGRLGEILVRLGILTPGQLDKLLAVQRDYVAKQQAQMAAAAAPAPSSPPATTPVLVETQVPGLVEAAAPALLVEPAVEPPPLAITPEAPPVSVTADVGEDRGKGAGIGWRQSERRL
ncbi:MAG TPA: hypothetical protein VKM72_23200, partial [Thermoanaerobaculia bacterium]|nr:hypothetical protein [Thermoanaerobaculia bacterium]